MTIDLLRALVHPKIFATQASCNFHQVSQNKWSDRPALLEGLRWLAKANHQMMSRPIRAIREDLSETHLKVVALGWSSRGSILPSQRKRHVQLVIKVWRCWAHNQLQTVLAVQRRQRSARNGILGRRLKEKQWLSYHVRILWELKDLPRVGPYHWFSHVA